MQVVDDPWTCEGAEQNLAVLVDDDLGPTAVAARRPPAGSLPPGNEISVAPGPAKHRDEGCV
jgi:hypothetical protein